MKQPIHDRRPSGGSGDRLAAIPEQESAEAAPAASRAPSKPSAAGEEWLDLARAHLESHAFNRALEAIEQGLSLKPNGKAALELLEVIKRGERAASQQRGPAAEAREAVRSVPGAQKTAPEAGEIAHHADRDRERTDRAMLLLSKVQELCDEVRRNEGVDLLRKAQRLDEENPLIRTMLVNSLFQRACHLCETDCEAADQLVSEILELQPHHAPARGLREHITSRKKEEYVAWCLVQARRMKAKGDLDGACAVIREGLECYPAEPRLSHFIAHHAPEALKPDGRGVTD